MCCGIFCCWAWVRPYPLAICILAMVRHKRPVDRQASCLLYGTVAFFLASPPNCKSAASASPVGGATLMTGKHDLGSGGHGRKLTAFCVTPRLKTVRGSKVTERTFWWVACFPGFIFRVRHGFKIHTSCKLQEPRCFGTRHCQNHNGCRYHTES